MHGAQFTCFSCTKVQILTLRAASRTELEHQRVGMVLEEAQAARERELQEQRLRKVCAQFTCVTSTREGRATDS